MADVHTRRADARRGLRGRDWVASCDDGQGVGKTAAEAIAQSLGEAITPIGPSAAILDEWVVQQAARLELELDEELDPDDG